MTSARGVSHTQPPPIVARLCVAQSFFLPYFDTNLPISFGSSRSSGHQTRIIHNARHPPTHDFVFPSLLPSSSPPTAHNTINNRDRRHGCLYLNSPNPLYSPNLRQYKNIRFRLIEFPSGNSRRVRPSVTSPSETSSPSTTASHTITWPPPSVKPRQPPQPVFEQDFDLFQQARSTSIRPVSACQPRVSSLDQTLHPLFNAANSALFPATGISTISTQPVNNSTQLESFRTTSRPPVPLFHSIPSTGAISTTNAFQYKQVIDSNEFAIMAGGEINVAYNGTFDDLAAATAAADDYFSMDGSFDFGATDSFTAVNVTAPATISPKELYNDSVPPSTAFTNLTTPGSTFFDTPEDEYQTSPLFNDSLDFGSAHAADAWFPLFPENDASAPLAAVDDSTLMTRTTSASSLGQIVVHPGGDSTRKRSAGNASPSCFSPALRHSSVAGVAARKRDKPLPPIVVSESDPVALKRARNTAAARKSRAKKVQERDELESEIADLKAQVEHWKALALGRASADVNDE